MTSFWTGTSDKKLQTAEEELVELAGLDLDEFKSYPVHFTFTEADWNDNYQEPELLEQPNPWFCGLTTSKPKLDVEDNEYIWTYEFGDISKPHIVIVHGFGGAGMIFFKMFKQLSQHFHVYLIDILGMGRSNRGDFGCETYQECENYFVNSIEKWRHKIGIDKMNLFGHSFGGFICSKYALRYAERINKLLLFSPWACEACTEDQLNGLDEEIDQRSFGQRTKYKLMKAVYKKSTPFEMARKAGRFLGAFLVKKFARRRFRGELIEEELEAIAEYLTQVTLRKGSSEYGFAKMFPYFNRSEHAVSNHLEEYKELGLEISFYFGEKDWMNTCFNGFNVSQQLQDAGEKVYIVPEAGHHIYFGNPDEAFSMILDDFKTSAKNFNFD
ncbi:unnamed protein product [Moneuplotes crassus]|uniref:AB hydrolase-1 domain-containing protein n=1 Tax=Euplotes crassus TaxID=5936 RepID=A0AAD2CV99_EUPCR|nr:unnamed protein product [Moneuplotes crassus]